MSYHDDEDELVELVEQFSPLVALDPQDIDALTEKQQRFLIQFLNKGSIKLARSAEKISLSDWQKWNQDEHFQKMFALVKNPLSITHSLRQALIFKAALRHFQLLDHEKAAVRQWAIELAYKLDDALPGNKPRDVPQEPSHDQIKKLAASIVKQLPETSQEIIQTRFRVIEGVPIEES